MSKREFFFQLVCVFYLQFINRKCAKEKTLQYVIPELKYNPSLLRIGCQCLIYILPFPAKVRMSLDISEEVVRKGTPNIHGRWSRRLGNLPASNLQGTTNCAAAFDFPVYSFTTFASACQTKLSKGEFDTWRLCLSLRLRGVSYVLGQFQNWPRNFDI